MDPIEIIDKDILRSSRLLKGVDISIKPKKMEVRIEELKVMTIKLILDEKLEISGVCHIKTKINLNSKFLVEFINKILPEYLVGEVFPDGKSKLEYPIYVVVKHEGVDPISALCLFENLKNVDNELDEFLKRRRSL